MANLGVPFGTIQTTYPNQMGTALVGSLASASDVINFDSMPVDETDGIKFGIGVVAAAATDPIREGVGAYVISLPAGSEAEEDFAGVVIRTSAGQCDENGVGMVGDKRVAAVARPNRAGFRIWVKDNSGDIKVGDPVFWIVKDGTGHGFDIGSFANAEITASEVTDTVELTTGRFVSNSDVSGLAVIEFRI